MHCRAFLTGLGAILAAPVASEAQTGKLWRICYLDGTSPTARAALLTALKSRLQDLGNAPTQYVLDSRYAEDDDARLGALAADLVRGKPEVIITAGPQPAFAAARNVQVRFFEARSPEEIDKALAMTVMWRPGALLIHSDGALFAPRRRIAGFAARNHHRHRTGKS